MKEEEKKRIFYNNREISWLDFNLRVLEEAFKKENPIMERVKFLSICASNLDEFFMVRVAGIMEQVHANYKKEDPSGLTPKKQLLIWIPHNRLVYKKVLFKKRIKDEV